jgi:pimeloyl-ACP methyl ester carboxylesterase
VTTTPTPTTAATTSTSSPTIWIDLPGARLAAQDEGDGPPIVLVHSAIVNRHSWDPVVPHLVAAGYRAIRYDMRGFGESTAEDVEFMAHEDLLAVLDHFGIRQAAVVGNSMGAAFAMNGVIAAPDRFVAYAWVGGGIGGWDKEPSPEEEAVFQAESAAEEAGNPDLAAEIDMQIWVDGWRDGVNQPMTRVPAATRDAIKRMDRELLEPGRVFGKVRRPDPPAIDRLGTITQPTLVVIGDLDTIGTKAAADKVAETVPGARIVHLPEVAHLIGMEAPDRLAALIVEHLAPLPRWS